jgi:multicomponent Na+:H+ antiporter subunit B
MTTVLTRLVSRALLAPTLAVAAAILIKGYADVGDGFAAGVVAALGVLVQYVAFGREAVVAELPIRHAPLVAMGGLALAVGTLAVPWLTGAELFQHTPGPGEDVIHIGTLELITPVIFDIGVFALVFGGSVTILDVIAAGEEGEDDELRPEGEAAA